MVTDRGRTWCSIAEAARLLGISERAVRKRIDAGRLETRREAIGNRVRTRVAVPRPGPGAAPGAATGAEPGAAEVRDLMVQLARLEERLAAAEAARATLERERAELRADLERERRAREETERRRAEDDRRFDEVLRQIGELRAARRQPERRPWPGLRMWLKRAWEGGER